MASNYGLSKAKTAKKDEFYTTYDDIQQEINHYVDKFAGKTVLCNCNDSIESNFCSFFLRNFNYLKLKRLICISYGPAPIFGHQSSVFELCGFCKGYVLDVLNVPMSNGRGVSESDVGRILSNEKNYHMLSGDGDFRSEECIAYLYCADIVVTNPPFSLFREFVAQLVRHNKSFLIIGNVNAITYREIFPLVKDNRIWLGASIHSGDRRFYVPNDYSLDAAGCGVEENGRKYICVKGVRWFTNLDYARRHEELVLYRKYYGYENEYPRYDNYNAINVDKTVEIPCDYYLTMGVPITFLDKHSPEQFEIIGATESEGKGFSAGLWDDKSGTAQPMVSGERKYKRLFVKRRMTGFKTGEE